jgi:transcription elongation regulator 1
MQSAASAAPKKDKPLVKTPIPGTEWIRVKTVQGNTFYNNKATKASVWIVPEEIREAVSMLEKEEEELRRTAETSKASDNIEGGPVKRKAEASHTNASKKAKTNAEEEDEDEESEEEEWQQEAAAQLAAEAEAAEQSRKEEERQAKEEARRAKEEMEEKAAKLNLPKREDLSLEEAKALFKVRFLLYGRWHRYLTKRRHSYKRRTSTRCNHGTCRCLSSCLIHDMAC